MNTVDGQDFLLSTRASLVEQGPTEVMPSMKDDDDNEGPAVKRSSFHYSLMLLFNTFLHYRQTKFE